MAEIEECKDRLIKLLDDGVRLVIKKQDEIYIMACEVEIDGKKYHNGFKFDSLNRLTAIIAGDDIYDAISRELIRRKNE